MSRTVVRVYSDYKSPYAYVALRPAYQLAEDYGLELEWRPYTLRIEEYLGAVETRNAHCWRRVRYSYMDARRYANKQGLILKGTKRVYNGYYANAGMLWAQQAGVFRPYHDTVFDRFWKQELDIDVLDEMKALVAGIGGDPEAYATWVEGPGRAEMDANIEEAEAMGVFGVPMFVLDGELFWGGDRIDLLKERLEEKRSANSGD